MSFNDITSSKNECSYMSREYHKQPLYLQKGRGKAAYTPESPDSICGITLGVLYFVVVGKHIQLVLFLLYRL